MRNLCVDKVVVDVLPGRFDQVLDEAIRLSETLNSVALGQCLVEFEFNNVTVRVTKKSDPRLIQRDYNRAVSGYVDDKVVGPYPRPVLTDEELESDARIEAEREERWAEKMVAAEAAAEAKRCNLEKRLAEAPVLEVVDPGAWERWSEANADSHGLVVALFAQHWARLMQLELSSGKKLEDIAEATAKEVDLDGISGATFYVASETLCAHWVHGAELKSWLNSQG